MRTHISRSRVGVVSYPGRPAYWEYYVDSACNKHAIPQFEGKDVEPYSYLVHEDTLALNVDVDGTTPNSAAVTLGSWEEQWNVTTGALTSHLFRDYCRFGCTGVLSTDLTAPYTFEQMYLQNAAAGSAKPSRAHLQNYWYTGAPVGCVHAAGYYYGAGVPNWNTSPTDAGTCYNAMLIRDVAVNPQASWYDTAAFDNSEGITHFVEYACNPQVGGENQPNAPLIRWHGDSLNLKPKFHRTTDLQQNPQKFKPFAHVACKTVWQQTGVVNGTLVSAHLYRTNQDHIPRSSDGRLGLQSDY